MEPNALNGTYRRRIAAFTAEHRFPTMDGLPELMDAGGLMVDGASMLQRSRRVAALVDKIFKGSKPEEVKRPWSTEGTLCSLEDKVYPAHTRPLSGKIPGDSIS